MTRLNEKIVINFPSRVVGWLNIWDTDQDVERRVFSDGGLPLPPWEPFYCVLRQDIKTFTCHQNEEDVDEQPGLREIPLARLDGGKEEFDKRWGYETLESIRENALQHHSAEITPDRLYTRSRLLDVTCNESLPDLTRGFDHTDHSRRRHMLFRKFFHSSYEKMTEERRGSLPLVTGLEDEEAMDTSSTPSRIANFFMKKGFKTNLKRTKSATKLDRKRSAANILEKENDSNSVVGTLKRTMSLGRLTRKRNRAQQKLEQTENPCGDPHHCSFPCECSVITPDNLRTWSLINSRIRSSRSHESLLTNSVTMHSIDLTSSNIEIKPLHSSILGQDHCFQVSTSHGSKYISCRTAEEREKWIGSLRKTIQPNAENTRRVDNSLKLWIKEAKNCSSKKRYFCEIFLDKTLYARTSSKTNADMLFWGEHFEFNNLPPVQLVTINLFREADKKKKKDKNTLVGYLHISISEINQRQFVEKWFTCSSGTVGKNGKENKSDLPLIRLKARYQTVHILPMDMYQDLIKYLSNEYTTLCEVMEGMVGVRDKEDIATTLVHIMQRLNKAKDFLSDVIMAEILKNENQNLTFRGNTIGTKAMEAYMKLVGEKYLQDTLGDFVKTMIDSEDDCEVDPTKVANPQVLQNHQRLLDMYCEMVWAKIINSHCYFPCELRDVFSSFRSRCKQYHKDDTADNLISACIFLRFLCPSILSPSLFNLTQEYPHEKAVRGLTLIAKTIQTLANLTKFGGKEEFMTFMNEFLERQWATMSTFLRQISSTEGNNQFLEFDGYIDLGKELSILHTLLTENLVKADMESLKKLGRLNSILGNITESLNNPDNDTVKKKVQNNRKSQIYDNLVNVPHPQMSTSPTEILRDLLRHCGEEDIPVLSGRRVTKQGSFDVGSSRHAASNLNTNDDYVNFNAVGSSSSSSGERGEVGNVSVTSHFVSNEHNVNQSWSEIVTAADTNHGDYIDLMNFIDDDPQNSSMELEQNMNGSQMSISQISTIASSGYQSFGYSQSSSPIDASAQEINQDVSKSPSMIQTLQPLSFSNPMYRHTQGSNSSRSVGASPMHQGSTSSGSLSSEEESSTVKHRSPVKTDVYRTSDPLRNLAPKLSSSSSSESLHELDKSVLETPPRPARCSRSMSTSGEPVKFTLGLHSSCSSHTFEDMHNSNLTNSHSHCYSLSRAPSRPGELTHAGSVDFTYLNKKYGGDPLRRTATDSKISQSSTCSPIHMHSDSGVSVNSNRGQMSPEESPAHRRLSPSNAVHMGIRSVQRKIYDQEKTKQEYEQEVSILKQQLVEAQKNLAEAELRLKEHESGTHQVVEDWQCRLEESEERMRKQQAEKDGQMKHIIQRLMTVEEDLRHDQQDMQKLVHQKQKVIEAQERRIQTLDTANAKLMTALNELRDRYTVTQQSRNGMLGPLRSKVNQSQLAEFKTSSC